MVEVAAVVEVVVVVVVNEAAEEQLWLKMYHPLSTKLPSYLGLNVDRHPKSK